MAILISSLVMIVQTLTGAVSLKKEVLVMEINLRQRKVETVVQIVKSLEDLWRVRVYYVPQEGCLAIAKKLVKISSPKQKPLAGLSSI